MRVLRYQCIDNHHNINKIIENQCINSIFQDIISAENSLKCRRKIQLDRDNPSVYEELDDTRYCIPHRRTTI